MPKEEWGVKRVCPTTGKRFYDLNNDPVISPYTGEVVPLDTGSKTRAAIKEEKPAEKSAGKAAEPTDEDAVLEDEDADVDLGDEVLEDDEEDNVSLDDIADVSSDDEES
jgi:uncharacterized protein (TIGR02300 family)